MKPLHKRQLSLAVAAALATTLTSGLAFGQDEDENDIEEIVITGTRIATEDGFGATSPVTVVTAENIKNLGFVNIEQVLNSLPSIETSQNANISNGSSGTASVDLRGLGTNRTLVLINGRRMQAGGAQIQAPDVGFGPGVEFLGHQHVLGNGDIAALLMRQADQPLGFIDQVRLVQ